MDDPHDDILEARADGHDLLVDDDGQLVIVTNWERPIDPQLRTRLRTYENAVVAYLVAERAAVEALASVAMSRTSPFEPVVTVDQHGHMQVIPDDDDAA